MNGNRQRRRIEEVQTRTVFLQCFAFTVELNSNVTDNLSNVFLFLRSQVELHNAHSRVGGLEEMLDRCNVQPHVVAPARVERNGAQVARASAVWLARSSVVATASPRPPTNSKTTREGYQRRQGERLAGQQLAVSLLH